MRYLTLFTLEVMHSYYADRRCPDFEIEPTPGTQKLLNVYRCVIKQFSNGLRILIAANDKGTPFLSLPKDLTFAFHLRLQNRDFSLFTDLETVNQLAAPLYANEAPAAGGDLIPVSRESRFTERFAVQQPAPGECFVVSGRPRENLKAAGAFVVKGLGKNPGQKRYNEVAKSILVNTSAPIPGTPLTVTYPIAPRLERDVFADVEIKYRLGDPAQSGISNSFKITFESKKARWKYYIVTDKSNGQAAIPSIEDKDRVIYFNAEDRTDLIQDSGPGDAIAAKLLKQYPHKQFFRFVSESLIPCQQAARKNIQLRLNGDKAIDSLPNPPLQNYCIDIRNAVREYALYQIVQYFI